MDARETAALLVTGVESASERWLITAAITIGAIMGALDMSIVNVALPYMRANLGATVTEITWVATGYIIALVIIMPLTAWLSQRFGRKRLYMACVALFAGASFMCGTSRTLTALVLFRCIQGIGAGVMQPVQQAILRETFPPHQQGLAMGIFGFAVMIGPAFGPTLGGWITDAYSWPWIFYINVPIGFIALWMIGNFVHDPPHARAQRGQMSMDALGVTMLAVGLACLQTVLEQGQSDNWFESDFIVTLTVIASVALIAFVGWEWRAPRPAVDLKVLKDPGFSSASFIGAILGVSLFASMFLLPLFLQELLGYTALRSGLVMMPRGLIMVPLLPLAGMLYDRVGPRPMITTGLLIAGFSPFMMSRFTLDTGIMGLLWPQFLQGVGFSLIFVSLSTAALAGIDRRRLTNAAGVYNLLRQLGGSFGMAIFASVLTNAQQASRVQLVKHLNPHNPAYIHASHLLSAYFVSRGFSVFDAHMKMLKALDGIIDQQATVMAFSHTFYIIGAISLACLPLVLLMKNAPQARPPASTE